MLMSGIAGSYDNSVFSFVNCNFITWKIHKTQILVSTEKNLMEHSHARVFLFLESSYKH